MPQDSERSATIRDVAAASGVSVGTVSRSLNAPETVRPVTLEKVRAAIQDLGFRPLVPRLADAIAAGVLAGAG